MERPLSHTGEVEFSPEALYEAESPRSISAFETNYNGGYPHNYPGERPATSFLADTTNVLAAAEGMVYPMMTTQDHTGRLRVEAKLDDNSRRIDLDDLLHELNQPGINDRIPLVAYGANVCPAAMQAKFALDDNPEAGVVPTLYATMPGYEAVWQEKPGQRGNGMATLYKGPETTDANIQVAVNFLTPEQLLLLHQGEKNYDLGYVGQVTLETGATIPALIYVGNEPVVLKDGHPIAIAAIPRDTNVLEPMTSEEVVDYMLDHEGTRHELAGLDPELAQANSKDYARVLGDKRLAEKKQIQAVVAAHTEKALVSMADPEFSGLEITSWANPNTIPTYAQLAGNAPRGKELILLPEQIIHGGSQKQREKIRKAVAGHFRTIIRPKL